MHRAVEAIVYPVLIGVAILTIPQLDVGTVTGVSSTQVDAFFDVQAGMDSSIRRTDKPLLIRIPGTGIRQDVRAVVGVTTGVVNAFIGVIGEIDCPKGPDNLISANRSIAAKSRPYLN